MAYADDYFQNQLNKSGDKVAWQYGTLVNYTGLGKPGLRVLDAGCGAAPGLRYLVSAGYDTYGTDLVTYPLEMARRLAPAARLSQSDLTAPFPYADRRLERLAIGMVDYVNPRDAGPAAPELHPANRAASVFGPRPAAAHRSVSQVRHQHLP